MRARAICVCRDAGVCDAVTTVLGERVEHHREIPADASDVALFLVDRATRERAGDALRSASAPVVIVGDSLEDDGVITLMLDGPVSHLLRDPADRELGITSEKLVSGDVFGLEKYLPPGAEVGERSVANDVEKRAATARVIAWAESIGARRPVIHRLASVVDELLMNALHDAPRGAAVSDGRAVLRWGADDRTLAISVADDFGGLRQRDLIGHVRRARDERGRPNPAHPGGANGAGLGLYLVLANVASLIVNVRPGRKTEVVCLFDLARTSHPAIASGVRSLHVFQQR
jgi:signal transduction histidine kinase